MKLSELLQEEALLGDIWLRQVAREQAAWVTGSPFHRREAERLARWRHFLTTGEVLR